MKNNPIFHIAKVPVIGNRNGRFHIQQIVGCAGAKNASIHHHEILIPANATPGNYHLMVYCTDAAGNEAHLARNVVLSTEGGEEYEH